MDEQKSSIFYKPNMAYAITINPCDDKQFFNDKERYKKFREFMSEQLIMFTSHNIHYTFAIELSEPRNNSKGAKLGSRLHLHGIINFRTNKSVRFFLLQGMTNLCKFSKWDIDTIKDYNIWKDYCNKQLRITKFKLLTNHLIIKDSNISTEL